MKGTRSDTEAAAMVVEADIIPIETPKCRILPDGRMTRRDAALYLGFAEKTLAMWALSGKGPRSAKIAGRRFYYKADLDAFKAAQ